jgi:hypothetical protein
VQRIGELTRELDKAEFGDGPNTAPRLPTSGKAKEQALADAGISKSAAQRYEELIGPPTEQGIAAAMVRTANPSA